MIDHSKRDKFATPEKARQRQPSINQLYVKSVLDILNDDLRDIVSEYNLLVMVILKSDELLRNETDKRTMKLLQDYFKEGCQVLRMEESSSQLSQISEAQLLRSQFLNRVALEIAHKYRIGTIGGSSLYNSPEAKSQLKSPARTMKSDDLLVHGDLHQYLQSIMKMKRLEILLKKLGF